MKTEPRHRTAPSDGPTPPPIRALSLDVGHTLLFPHPSVGTVYSKVGRRHGFLIPPNVATQRFATAWKDEQNAAEKLTYGTTHEHALAFWIRLNRNVLHEHNPPDDRLRTFVHDLYTTFAKPDCWRINEDWHALRQACSINGIILILLSNWDLRLRPLLHELDLIAPFRKAIISAEVGAEKPDPAIFEHAVQATGLDPAAILHVGDTWKDDVLGAHAAGMRAAWFNPARNPLPTSAPPVLNLKRLTDLVPRLASGTLPQATATAKGTA